MWNDRCSSQKGEELKGFLSTLAPVSENHGINLHHIWVAYWGWIAWNILTGLLKIHFGGGGGAPQRL